MLFQNVTHMKLRGYKMVRLKHFQTGWGRIVPWGAQMEKNHEKQGKKLNKIYLFLMCVLFCVSSSVCNTLPYHGTPSNNNKMYLFI